MRADGATLSSSLCETTSAEVLLAGAKPLAVGAPGPAVLLVSGNIGGFNYVVLNQSGEIVAGINGPDGTEAFEQPWQFSVCPGGEMLVEQWSSRMIVRDLTDLSVTREIDLQDYTDTTSFTATRCMSQDGSEILLAGEEWSGDRSTARLFKVTDSLEPGLEVPSGQVQLGETFAVVQDHESGAISAISYESGEVTSIRPVKQIGPDDNYAGATAIAISPDSSTIGVAEVDYEGLAGPESKIVLFDAEGTQLATASLDGEVYWLWWLDSERLVANKSTKDEINNSATVYRAPRLDIEQELAGWQGYNPVMTDGVVYAMEGGSMMTAELKTGEVDQIATLPTQFVGPIALLPAEFDISPGLIASPEANTPNTVPPLISDAFGGSSAEAEDVSGTARVILVALLVGVVAWIAYTATSRRRDSTKTEGQS